MPSIETTLDATAGNTYRSFLDKAIAVGTSKNVTAATVNAGGSGYVVGDTVTINHAGAVAPLELEVTAVSSGAITTVIINYGGAFSNRVASLSVATAGSGYSSGDVLELQGGTSTEKCRVSVVAAAGAVTSATVVGNGGAYSVAPSSGASTRSGGTDGTAALPPGTGTGTGCELTATMTGEIGTTAVAQTSTSGSGTGATFDLTLTQNTWSVERFLNNITINSVTDEREVVLRATITGAQDALVGMRTYTQTSGLDTRYGVLFFGMTAFNDQTALSAQTGLSSVITPGSQGSFLPILDGLALPIRVTCTTRFCRGVLKNDDTLGGGTVISYSNFGFGLYQGYAVNSQNPYPAIIFGSSSEANISPISSSTNITSICEANGGDSGGAGPIQIYDFPSNTWLFPMNVNNGVRQRQIVVYPLGSPAEIGGSSVEADKAELLPTETSQGFLFNTGTSGLYDITSRTSASRRLRTTLGDDDYVRIPLLLLQSLNTTAGENSADDRPLGTVEGMFWVSAIKPDNSLVSAEDTLRDADNTRHRFYPTGAASSIEYLYFAVSEV